MKTRKLTATAVLLGLALLTAASSSAAVIVSESFGGLDTDNLAGSTVDINTTGGATTWSGNAIFKQNGGIVGGTANLGRSAHVKLGTYIIDARGTANGVFVLSATLNQTVSNNQDNVVTAGFSTFANPSSTANFGTLGVATMALRPSGDIDQFATLNTNEVAADETSFTSLLPVTMIITLDLSSAAYNGTTTFGTVRFGANTGVGRAYQEFGTYNYTSAAQTEIRSLLLATAAQSGGYSLITLEQVPEPSTALLGGLGLLALLRRRR